jgi:sirohydrochlorin cobaltochelatase
MTTAIVLLAHGSPDPTWLDPVVRLAARMRAQSPGLLVGVATLDHGPVLADIVADLAARGAARVVVVAVLLSGGGRHMRRDIPELVASVQAGRRDLAVELAGDALGEDPLVIDAMATAALKRAALSSAT